MQRVSFPSKSQSAQNRLKSHGDMGYDNFNRLVYKPELMECLLAQFQDKSYPNLPFQKQRLKPVELKAYSRLTVC